MAPADCWPGRRQDGGVGGSLAAGVGGAGVRGRQHGACDRQARPSRDRVREVIHRFNDEGMASWTLGGRVAVRITTDDDFIVEAATALRRWGCLSRGGASQAGRLSGRQPDQGVKISAERLRQTGGPGRDVSAHQDLEGVQRPRARRQVDRRGGRLCFASTAADDPPRRRGGVGSRGAPAADRGELPQGPRGRQFHGCYSIGEDVLWGVVRQRKLLRTPWPRSSRSGPATATASGSM